MTEVANRLAVVSDRDQKLVQAVRDDPAIGPLVAARVVGEVRPRERGRGTMDGSDVDEQQPGLGVVKLMHDLWLGRQLAEVRRLGALPVALDEMITSVRERRAAPDSSIAAGDLARYCTLLGRNDAPGCVREPYDVGAISAWQLTDIVGHLWCLCEWPCRAVPRRIWLAWFQAAAFVSDTGRAQPEAPLRVWRAQVGRTIGLSWTTNSERARWFRARNERAGRRDARIMHAVAQPRDVLALIDGRNEDEVLVSPATRFWRRSSAATGSPLCSDQRGTHGQVGEVRPHEGEGGEQ